MVTVPTFVEKDLSLRVKVGDACGLTCTFCHNEGVPVTGDNRNLLINPVNLWKNEGSTPIWKDGGRSGRRSIYSQTNGVNFLSDLVEPDAEFIAALNMIREVFGTTEIHLTGGEPTLHPRVSEIVRVATENGYVVGMTSNGENPKAIAPSAATGLDRVNFSIFGTTPQELAEVQNQKFRNEKLAEAKLKSLAKSIDAALSNDVKASANIVVLNHDHIPRVHRLLEQYSSELSVRLLNSLDDGQASIDAIHQIFADLDAKPVANYVTAGVSGARTVYELPDKRKIQFKKIRTVRLPDTCQGCSLNNPVDCQEGYYGMRLYKAMGGGYVVGICIQRMDLTMPVSEFVNSNRCQEVLDFREQEYRQLTAAE